jgi:hypothetical protein
MDFDSWVDTVAQSHRPTGAKEKVMGPNWSDENLKQAISEVEDALSKLRDLGTHDDVQGHAFTWSDENLKQAISEVEGALAKLREFGSTGDDVQGHAFTWLDENVKQAIESLTGALASLRELGTNESDDGEGHRGHRH